MNVKVMDPQMSIIDVIFSAVMYDTQKQMQHDQNT